MNSGSFDAILRLTNVVGGVLCLVEGRLDATTAAIVKLSTSEMQIEHGAHRSVKALVADIMYFVAKRNADPKPVRWTKSADDILASIEQ